MLVVFLFAVADFLCDPFERAMAIAAWSRLSTT